MALSGNTIWETRTGGNDTNGGAFVAGASGTDYSQQNGKNTVGNNISTTDAVATGTTTITSLTASFTSAIVGNIVYFAGGTGSLAAVWRQVTGFTNSTTITVDATVAAGTGITMDIGGALATLQVALNSAVSSNVIWVVSGTYSSAATVSTGTAVYVSGYSSTRGDSGQATLQVSGAVIPLTNSGNGVFRNLILDANNQGVSALTNSGANLPAFLNIKAINWGTAAAGHAFIATGSGIGFLQQCVATSPKAGSTAHGFSGWGQVTSFIDCIADGATSIGFNVAAAKSIMTRCMARNCGGKGFSDVARSVMDHCAADNNTGDGASIGSTSVEPCSIRNCIFTNNGGIGLNITATLYFLDCDYNAFYNNSGGATAGLPSTSGPKNITLTATPWVSSSTGNYALNTNPGGGAAVRAASQIGVVPGLPNTTSYLDLGPYQHQDPAVNRGLLIGQGVSVASVH